MYKPDTTQKDTNWKEFWAEGVGRKKKMKKALPSICEETFEQKINEGIGQDDFLMSLPTSTILIPQLCNCSDGLRHK